MAESLCTSCGACCDGSLFRFTPISEEEAAWARRRSLALLPSREPRMVQPCGALEGARCRVYEERPETCRRFRCRVLKRLESGDIDRAEAEARVARLRELIARVRLRTGPGPLWERVRESIAQQRPTAMDAAFLAWMLDVAELRAYARTTFLPEGHPGALDELPPGPA